MNDFVKTSDLGQARASGKEKTRVLDIHKRTASIQNQSLVVLRLALSIKSKLIGPEPTTDKDKEAPKATNFFDRLGSNLLDISDVLAKSISNLEVIDHQLTD